MKSALFIATAAFAGLALTPAAQAQVTCDDVARISAYAADGFDAILGEEIETDMFAATLELAGATTCRVNYGWSDSYICTWQFRDEASAAAAAAEHQTMLEACLTDDWSKKVMTPESSAEWRLLSGIEFSLEFDNGDLEIISRADASTDPTAGVFEVEMSIDYFW